MRHTWLIPAIAYAALSAPGCAAPDSPFSDQLGDALADGPVGSSESPIQGGYLDEADTNVVGVVHLEGGGIATCSGTLIAPNVVLTAHHCVAPTSGNGGVMCGQTFFGTTYAPDSLYVTTHTEFSQNPSDYHLAQEIFVPSEDTEFCGLDMAVIVLDAPVPATEAVPVVPRVDSSLVADEEYYAVGYGQLSDGGPSGTRYRRDTLFVQCVAEECPSAFIFTEEFLGDTGVCQGDSGGPAMDMQNRVVGVASRGGSGCSNPVYGHVFGHGQWLKDVVGYATSANNLEVPAWATGFPTDPAFSLPVGAACSVPEDCPSNACLNGYCTRPCTDVAYCPDNYICGGSGYCEEPPPVANDDGGSTTVSNCAVAAVGQDPTKPIPWVITPLALLGLLLLRRRDDS